VKESSDFQRLYEYTALAHISLLVIDEQEGYMAKQGI